MTPNDGQGSTADPGMHADELARICAALTHRYRGVFSAEDVAVVVHEAYASLAADAKVTSFLPVLTEHLARDRLQARLATQSVAEPKGGLGTT